LTPMLAAEEPRITSTTMAFVLSAPDSACVQLSVRQFDSVCVFLVALVLFSKNLF